MKNIQAFKIASSNNTPINLSMKAAIIWTVKCISISQHIYFVNEYYISNSFNLLGFVIEDWIRKKNICYVPLLWMKFKNTVDASLFFAVRLQNLSFKTIKKKMELGSAA